ncbi:NAD(P)/FAD-dependent oxidoreductase [Streptomyces sp. NPDC001351]|uniref:NAD(P)/FAD-dependent oxidoreductase n=1 Tax=Streptomyces sp. NPDC001351 TaxID=3364564 RepID=UPI0036C1A9EE
MQTTHRGGGLADAHPGGETVLRGDDVDEPSAVGDQLRWFDDPDDLVGLIRDPWVGGRPFLPDGLPVIDRVPGHDNAFVATGHGMLGVTLGPVTGRRLTEYVRTGRRPQALEPFRFDRLRH